MDFAVEVEDGGIGIGAEAEGAGLVRASGNRNLLGEIEFVGEDVRVGSDFV